MYAAEIVNGRVLRAIVGFSYDMEIAFGGTWVQSDIRPGIGWKLHEDGSLRPPQPFPSWSWSDEWKPPTAYPVDGGWYKWDEESLSWLEIPYIDE